MPGAGAHVSIQSKDRAKLCESADFRVNYASLVCESCRREIMSSAPQNPSPPATTEPPATREARGLLVDDDRELCQKLTHDLNADHFEVRSVHDGAEALAEMRNKAYEILILDVMLPTVSGFDVLREIGTTNAPPVLMLTARGEDVDRIVGLELGADDYLAKPFNPRELVARIRAILRRAGSRAQRGAATDTVEVGPVKLNMSNHQVRVAGNPVVLTGAELRGLELLMGTDGQVISRTPL